jgi:hypothetical protein
MKVTILLLCIFSVVLSKYTSGESIYEMTKLSSTIPEPKNCWGFPCETFIWGTQITKPETAAFTCFGYIGPLSSIGPLGPLGPLGDNSFNPDKIFQLLGNWESIKKYITGNGPLDHPQGVLSRHGPLGDSYFTVMPRINDFTAHMMQFGIWSIMGPLGPLGALGGLGPLGPIGAHGFGRNSQGDYTNSKGEIVTTAVSIWNESTKITWPLFEKYTYRRAQELSRAKQLDTSFMTSNNVALVDNVYVIKSTEKQIISIVTVPYMMNYQFVIEVVDVNNRVIASSRTAKVINWVQFESEAGNEFYTVKIKSHTINCFTSISCMGSYILHVTGSTQQMLRAPGIPYRGQYIIQ